MSDDVEQIAKGLTKDERSALLKHHRTTEDRWLYGSFLGEHGSELLYHRSLNLELQGKPPIWERRAQDSCVIGVTYLYRPSAVLGLQVRQYLERNPQ